MVLGGTTLTDSPTTTDRLLGGRLQLSQPLDGYRFAIDPVFMAAAVNALPGQQVLDLGSGVGTAAFCLACRVGGLTVRGLEIQAPLVDLANSNAQANDLDARVSFTTGDLRDVGAMPLKAFDHVMANPPHFEDGSLTPPEHAGKAVAHVEQASLEDWIKAASRWIKDRGSLTMVHRADRLDDVIASMAQRFGSLAVMPLWPRQGKPARRVIVQGLKGSRGPARMLPGLVLHDAVDKYTAEARQILEECAALNLGES